ncbi:MAG: hypothetical protein JW763_07555 [candidate division Zixibacteria bacterium]|nr:hypothetical protein [candidate division Zixibacteria bacterium]
MTFRNKFHLLCVVIAMLNGTAFSANLLLPINTPEFQFAYDLAHRDEIAKGPDRLEYAVAPYRLLELPAAVPVIHQAHNLHGDRLRMFLLATEDVTSRKYARAEGYEYLRGGVMTTLSPHWSMYVNFLFDEKLADDPDYTGKKWRGLAGEVENAFVAGTYGNVDIIFGRFGVGWGPAAQSLVLSSTACTMDALSVRVRWNRFYFTYQAGKLDGSQIRRDSSTVTINRCFAGHRLDFRAVDQLYIGLFETVIFGGEGRAYEPAYLNPINFYHAWQLNEDTDDNTLLGFDLRYYIGNRHKAYAQMLFDDFQVDDEAQGDQEPNEIGMLCGIQSLDWFGDYDFKIEYVRITNRTYNQSNPYNRYLNRDNLIGHPFGCDGERVDFTCTRWLAPTRRARLELSYQRRGEGRVDDVWTEPWMDIEGEYNEPFPTGTVETTYSGALSFSGFVRSFAYVDLTAGIERIENYGHIQNDHRTVPFVNSRLTVLLSTILRLTR